MPLPHQHLQSVIKHWWSNYGYRFRTRVQRLLARTAATLIWKQEPGAETREREAGDGARADGLLPNLLEGSQLRRPPYTYHFTPGYTIIY